MSQTLDIAEIRGAVLVIAPHPDDETLGCGGLLAALVRQGNLVHTIFVTDGSSSHANSAAWPAERLALQRKKEAGDALALLGAAAQPRTFLALKDAAMPRPGDARYETAVAAMVDILRTIVPVMVLAPWRRDPHRDHRDAWSLLMAALGGSGQRPDVLEYTIWLEELGAPADFPTEGEVETITFSSSDMVVTKRAAIAAHQSQLGALITDDPTGFFLTAETLDRLINPTERFWRA